MSKYNYPNWHEIKDLVMIYHEHEWDNARVKVWNPREQQEYDLIFCGSSRPDEENIGEINFVVYPSKKIQKTFFISGHRDVTEEEFEVYKKRIDEVLWRYPDAEFVVGDYQGVDIMAQNYLVKKKVTDRVTVYHMFDSPRNFNPEIKSFKGGFKNDEERDACMTRDSDEDIAFVREGKRNSGTAQNIVRRFELFNKF